MASISNIQFVSNPLLSSVEETIEYVQTFPSGTGIAYGDTLYIWKDGSITTTPSSNYPPEYFTSSVSLDQAQDALVERLGVFSQLTPYREYDIQVASTGTPFTVPYTPGRISFFVTTKKTTGDYFDFTVFITDLEGEYIGQVNYSHKLDSNCRHSGDIGSLLHTVTITSPNPERQYVLGVTGFRRRSLRYFTSQLPSIVVPNDNTNTLNIIPCSLSQADVGNATFAVLGCARFTGESFVVYPNAILNKVDNSILWLIQDTNKGVQNLFKEAQNRNVDPKRIIFANRINTDAHLARHKVADLFIDTFPYTAHTTCSDALWSGLPVITRIGQSFASRVSASLLSAIGLPELITKSAEEYENLIFELSTNLQKLDEIKNKLKENITTKPLFNTELFTKNIELAYKTVYENYLKKYSLKNIII